MKELYKKIIELFTSEVVKNDFIVNGVEPVKHIDLYKGQYLGWEKFEVAPLPALFLDWSIIENNESSDNKGRTIQLTVYVIYLQMLETSSISNSLNEAVKFFDFIDLVHKHLQGTSTKTVGALNFTEQNPIALDRPGIVHTLNYTAVFNGYTTDVKDKYVYTIDEETYLNLDGDIVKNINNLLTNPFM